MFILQILSFCRCGIFPRLQYPNIPRLCSNRTGVPKTKVFVFQVFKGFWILFMQSYVYFALKLCARKKIMFLSTTYGLTKSYGFGSYGLGKYSANVTCTDSAAKSHVPCCVLETPLISILAFKFKSRINDFSNSSRKSRGCEVRSTVCGSMPSSILVYL